MGFWSNLIVKIKGDNKGLKDSLNDSKKEVRSFGDSMAALGKVMAGIFAVGKIIDFSKESMRLAAEVEGISNAYRKLENADNILSDLKKATRGVLDESDLMQLAVKANNYKVPLQDLAKYMEFATNRALTMGQSASEFANLMITALGRGAGASRSLIRMGLSTKDVNAALKDSGGLLKLVNSEMAKMGIVTDTATVRSERFNASLQNMKESWGALLNQSSAIKTLLTWVTTEFQILGDSNLSGGQKFRFFFNDKEYTKLKEQSEWIKKNIGLGNNLSQGSKWTAPWSNQTGAAQGIETIATLNLKLQEEKKALEEIDVEDKKGLLNQAKVIKALEERIKKITDLTNEAERLKVELDKVDTSILMKPEVGLGLDIQRQLWANKGADTSGGLVDNPNTRRQGEAAAQLNNDITDGLRLQQQTLIDLADTWAGFFSDVDKGFKGMIDGVIKGIERMVMELISKMVFMELLSLITGVPLPAGWIKNVIPGGNLFPSKAGGSTSAGTLASSNIGSEQLLATLRGKDIALTLRRL